MSMSGQIAELWREPWAGAAAVLAVFWLSAAWRAFRAEFNASRWALRPDRHKILKALAYAGALPFRIVFAAFTGLVETLVWTILAGGVWLLWKILRG
jgi:hypothetical protein